MSIDRIHRIGEFYPEDSDGDHYVTLYQVPLDFMNGMSDKEFIDRYFPGSHCKHSYDCCGGWYPNRGKIVHKDNIYQWAYIEVHTHQNV